MLLPAAYQIRHDAVVVSIRGDIDLVAADRFRTHVRSGLDAAAIHPQRLLVVDLKAVSFLGSVALRHLSTCRDEAVDAGVTLCVVNTDPTAARLLQLTHLDRLLPVHASVDGAVRSIEHARRQAWE